MFTSSSFLFRTTMTMYFIIAKNKKPLLSGSNSKCTVEEVSGQKTK